MSGSEARILVVGTRVEARRVLNSAGCKAQVEVSSEIGVPAGAGFDAVLLPLALLGERAEGVGTVPSQALASLVREAHAALRPGGVVVGHFENLVSLATLRTAARGQVSWRTWRVWRGTITTNACLRALTAAGFAATECFYVEPRISAPMSLVPRSWWPARTHFLRAVRRSRSSYGRAGYLARLALAAVGFGGLLQPHLFFWARRAC